MIHIISANFQDHYEVLQRIGGGAYADVYRVRCRRSGDFFAMKQERDRPDSSARAAGTGSGSVVDAFPASVLREANALRALVGRPNIVQLIAICSVDDEKVDAATGEPKIATRFVMEFCPGILRSVVAMTDNLRRRARNKAYVLMTSGEPVTGDDTDEQFRIHAEAVRAYMKGILSGLAEMHVRGYIHGDLKTDNVLLAVPSSSAPSHANADHEGSRFNALAASVRIADFGLTRCVDLPLQPFPHVHVIVTCDYRAPELLVFAPDYTCAGDLWSAGCIMAELAVGQRLFRATEAPPRDVISAFRSVLFTAASNRGDFDGFQEYPGWARFASQIVDSRFSRSSTAGDADADNVRRLEPSRIRNDAIFAWATAHRDAVKIVGADGADLLSRLLVIDPHRRITAQEALAHPFLTR